MNDTEAVHQVFAELPCRDQLRQIPVCRRNNAHVDAGGVPIGPDRLDLAVFKEAQQHGLHAQTHLADLIEKNGAPVRYLELAGLVTVRSGKTALHMSEEL